jgi:hypothetical protein
MLNQGANNQAIDRHPVGPRQFELPPNSAISSAEAASFLVASQADG